MIQDKPTYKHYLEWENKLAETRVAAGYTLKKLAKAAKMKNYTQIISFQNGMQSPTYLIGFKKGTVKPAVINILKVLNVEFEDIFPRYFCDLKKGELINSQIKEILESEYSTYNRPNKKVFKKRLSLNLKKILSFLSPIEKNIINLRFFDDMTLKQIANVLNITAERVRQIEARALKKLRHPTRSNYLR